MPIYVSTSAAEFAFPAFVSSSSISVSGVCSLGIENSLDARIASEIVCRGGGDWLVRISWT